MSDRTSFSCDSTVEFVHKDAKVLAHFLRIPQSWPVAAHSRFSANQPCKQLTVNRRASCLVKGILLACQSTSSASHADLTFNIFIPSSVLTKFCTVPADCTSARAAFFNFPRSRSRSGRTRNCALKFSGGRLRQSQESRNSTVLVRPLLACSSSTTSSRALISVSDFRGSHSHRRSNRFPARTQHDVRSSLILTYQTALHNDPQTKAESVQWRMDQWTPRFPNFA